MLKNILKLNGVQELSKNEQQSTTGGMFGGLAGTPCDVACGGTYNGMCGLPHCPGTCDGQGGYIIF